MRKGGYPAPPQKGWLPIKVGLPSADDRVIPHFTPTRDTVGRARKKKIHQNIGVVVKRVGQKE